MTDDVAAALERVRALVETYRGTCLWYLRPDYAPQTIAEALQVLSAIERNGDVTAFREAATLRQWLSLRSNAPSAAS